MESSNNFSLVDTLSPDRSEVFKDKDWLLDNKPKINSVSNENFGKQGDQSDKTSSNNGSSGGISKNQLKKRRRLEKKMEVKRRRKQQDKEVKLAKAKAVGRSIEEERKLQEERRLAGDGKKKREKDWIQKMSRSTKIGSFKVCIDCSFESFMTAKEINSLAMQVRYCYASNKRSKFPCPLAVTSLSGQTLAHLKNVNGFDEWHNRAFSWTSDSIEIFYKDDVKNIVYLTSDSEHTLQDLDNNEIYVIGGIVDRNRLKRAAWNRATELKIKTAKLPLEQYLSKMEATPVLTCNHVFDILMNYRTNGKNWEKALIDVLPSRKAAKLKGSACSKNEATVAADDTNTTTTT